MEIKSIIPHNKKFGGLKVRVPTLEENTVSNGFIIVTKDLEKIQANEEFINYEISRLLQKGIDCYVFHTETHFILCRELDDSIFMNTEWNVVNYMRENRKAINDMLGKYEDIRVYNIY